jgi:hypothetical protein
MEEFMRQLDGAEVKVVLEHSLFDKQKLYCSKLQTINDDKRIGVLLRGSEIFMYKQDVKVVEINNNTYTMSDGRLTINIIKL